MAITTTIEELKRLEYALSQKGTVYCASEAIPGSTAKIFLLPVNKIYAIGMQVADTSDLTIQATMATPEEVEAETALWDTWDGVSLFNLAVRAIKVTNNEAVTPGFFTLTVKGDI